MKWVFIVGIVLTGFAFAQEGILQDLPDINDYLEKFEGGIPTVANVQAVKTDATKAFDEGRCEDAIPLLEIWQEQANALANLYRNTLEPFYDASYDQRENFSISRISDFVSNEEKSNEQIYDRNTAWVMLGECNLKVGNSKQALGYFLKALDYISVSVKEQENWTRAATGVMQIIGAEKEAE